MIDQHENIPYEPSIELKEKLDGFGYSYSFYQYCGLQMVRFDLPKGELAISVKQALKKNVQALINDAMNQDAIKAGLSIASIINDDDNG